MWGFARHFPGRLWRQEKFDTVTGYMTVSGDLRSHAPVHIHPMPLINALILAVDMGRCSEIAGSAAISPSATALLRARSHADVYRRATPPQRTSSA
jgi:hypothetical protein